MVKTTRVLKKLHVTITKYPLDNFKKHTFLPLRLTGTPYTFVYKSEWKSFHTPPEARESTPFFRNIQGGLLVL